MKPIRRNASALLTLALACEGVPTADQIVPMEQVPPKVMEAARKELPGYTFDTAFKIKIDARDAYEVRGKDKRLMDLQLQLLVADKPLSGELMVPEQQPPPAELTLHTDGSLETSLVAMGVKVGSWFTDAVRVKWE